MKNYNTGNYKKKVGYKNQQKYKGKYYKNKIYSIDDFFEYEKKNSENNSIKTHFYHPEEHKKEKEKEITKKIFISHKNLTEIMNKDVNTIIQFFMKYNNLSEVIKNTRFNPDMIYLMTEIMSKIAFTNSGSASIILKQIIENTNFLEMNIKNCLSLSNINLTDEKALKFLLNLINFSDKLLDKFSDNHKRIRPGDLLDIEDMLSYEIEENENKENDKNQNKELIKNIIEKIKLFKERERQINLIKLKEKKEKIKEGKNDKKDNEIIPIDYKSADLILKTEDFIVKNNKEIAPHIKVGPYFSYERYINTNFYLEREDCYRSLRNAINVLQTNGKSINSMRYNEIKDITKKFSDLYFYINGEINYIDINSYGVIITLDFLGVNSRKIKFTKRMITGSLIVLTDNNYTDYLLTTVFYNPYFDLKGNEDNKINQKLKYQKSLIIEFNYLLLILILNHLYFWYKIGKIYKYLNLELILNHIFI